VNRTSWRRAAIRVLPLLVGCGQPAEVSAITDGDAACPGSGAEAPSGECANDLPASDRCGAMSPSYRDETSAIVQARCTICHANTAVNRYAFVSYASIAAARQPMLTQVYACRMPPACAPVLTASERRALLQWLVCGAPDN
jgi:uncharacterized membrane protein